MISDKGKFINSAGTLTEKGRRVFGNVSEIGYNVLSPVAAALHKFYSYIMSC